MGALGDDLADGLRRQWAVNDAGGSAPDPLEEGAPRAQISGLDPLPQRTNRVSLRVLPAHNTDHAPLALLVALAVPQGDDDHAGAELEVVDVEGGEFAATQSGCEPHEDDRGVPLSPQRAASS